MAAGSAIESDPFFCCCRCCCCTLAASAAASCSLLFVRRTAEEKESSQLRLLAPNSPLSALSLRPGVYLLSTARSEALFRLRSFSSRPFIQRCLSYLSPGSPTSSLPPILPLSTPPFHPTMACCCCCSLPPASVAAGAAAAAPALVGFLSDRRSQRAGLFKPRAVPVIPPATSTQYRSFWP